MVIKGDNLYKYSKRWKDFNVQRIHYLVVIITLISFVPKRLLILFQCAKKTVLI